MPDVKWIHLTTDMFDDDKIRLIEAMPDADTLLIIWVKLLCQAGKVNADGYIWLSEDMPYTEENLATVFNRPLNTIRLALSVFANLHMIEITDNGIIFLPNWEKHQNIYGLERIREQTRVRVAKHRQRKLLASGGSNVTSRYGNAPDKIRKDKNIYIDNKGNGNVTQNDETQLAYQGDGTIDEQKTIIHHQSLWRIRRILRGEETASEANKRIYRQALEKLEIPIEA